MAKVEESISRTYERVDVIESLLSEKKEFIVKQATNVILLLIILVVFGCLDFATLTFHFENLVSVSFWGTIISKLIAGMCAFNIGINFMWETELKKAQVLQSAMNLYNTLIAYKQLDFEEFIVKFYNPKLKKEAYKNKINHEIYLLNRFSRRKDRLLYSSDLKERQEEKKKNHYCIKRAELEELKSDEYIDKNIDNIMIKYSEVDASIFELEIDGSSKKVSMKTTGNVALGRAKATSSMALGMVFFAMFTTALGLEFSQQEFVSQMERFWHYVLKCAEDAGIIIWQVIKGFGQPKKIISQQLTTPYTNRNKVLSEYICWRKRNNKTNDAVYEELHTEVVELTEEQLNEIKRSGTL